MTDASLANVVFAAFPVAFAAVTLTLYRPSSERRGPRRPASGLRCPRPAPPDARA
jgi:hypothetical protein